MGGWQEPGEKRLFMLFSLPSGLLSPFVKIPAHLPKLTLQVTLPERSLEYAPSMPAALMGCMLLCSEILILLLSQRGFFLPWSGLETTFHLFFMGWTLLPPRSRCL